MKNKEKMNKILDKLNRIEQEIKLGTFDNVILALMIFILVVGFELIKTFERETLLFLLKNPILFLGYLFFIFFSLIVLSQIGSYAISIFCRNGRFWTKIKSIKFIVSLTIFLVLSFTLSLIFYGVEYIFEFITIPNWMTITLMSIIIVVLAFFIIPRINRKLNNYFLEEYPNLLLKRIKELNREERKKSLKKLGITLPKLKKLAEKYN